MAMWKNDDEMFALMKEKLYTPVVGDILDQMGYEFFVPYKYQEKQVAFKRACEE